VLFPVLGRFPRIDEDDRSAFPHCCEQVIDWDRKDQGPLLGAGRLGTVDRLTGIAARHSDIGRQTQPGD
jgi:hypothetical protein